MRKALLFFLLLAVAWVPLFLLAAYNHPTDDDFCTYQLFHQRTAWEALTFGYESFSGRFTYLLLFAQWDPLYHSDWLFWTRLWPLITLLAFLATLRVLVWVAQLGARGTQQWMVWGIVSSVALASWPSIASSFFWFTGATVYTLATLAALLALMAWHHAHQTTRVLLKAGLLFVVPLLALIAVGSNEVLIAFLMAFIGLTILWDGYNGSPVSRTGIVLLVVISCGAYVALTAPGNFRRATDMLHRSADLTYALQTGVKSLYLVALKAGTWLMQAPLWMAGLLVAAASGPKSFRWLVPANSLQVGILAAAFYLMMVAMAFLSCYAYNDIIPRVWNLLYFFFVFAFLFLILHLTRLVPAAAPVVEFVRNRWNLFATLTLCLCLISGESNLNTAWNDLVFRAPEYDVAMTQRYEVFRTARENHQTTVVVEPVFRQRYQYPRSLFLNDLGVNPAEFPNSCIGYFFGLDSVQLSCCPQESRHLQ
jgi:hypothetical protein